MECSVNDCSKPAFARRMCSMHYTRWQRHGDSQITHPRGPQPVIALCSINGCRKCSRRRGMCVMHYTRVLRYGDPFFVSKRMGQEKKKTLHAMVTPCSRDLNWAAGFVEGEGCFHRTRKGGSRVHVPQVNREPVDRLLSLFGGSLKLYRLGGPNPIWIWSASGARARGIMLTLYSMMSTKRKAQISRALCSPT